MFLSTYYLCKFKNNFSHVTVYISQIKSVNILWASHPSFYTYNVFTMDFLLQYYRNVRGKCKHYFDKFWTDDDLMSGDSMCKLLRRWGSDCWILIAISLLCTFCMCNKNSYRKNAFVNFDWNIKQYVFGYNQCIFWSAKILFITFNETHLEIVCPKFHAHSA